MEPLTFICQELGFFTRAHARGAGYDDRAVTREVRARRWTRIRRGYYVVAAQWASATPEERHLIRCRAVMHSLGDAVALSHVSGCLVHGIDVWGLDLSRVHVTRLDGGAGRTEGDVVHHEGFVAHGEVRQVDGLRVLPPARCALEAGSLGTSEAGLVVANSGLHKDLFTEADLANQFDVMAHWPHVRHLHVSVRMSTDKAESVGESRGLWLFRCQNLPRPELQFVITKDGRFIARTDWGWRQQGVLGEFDGKCKYGRLLKPGQDPGEVVFAEKRREDAAREATGFQMIRLVWRDFDSPDATGARIRRMLRRAA